MITKASQRRHAERIIREHKGRMRHLAVLAGMARREGRWGHVDWSAVEAALSGRK